VSQMRELQKIGTLAADRKERLKQAGFIWHADDSKWEQKFRELLAFRQANGHCRVPKVYKSNPSLGTWVCSIRRRYKSGLLTPDYMERLEQAGLVWDLDGNHWEQKFRELIAFRQANGHCLVPRECESNPALGNWVRTVRRSHKAGKLTADREVRLVSVGFVWSLRDHGGSSSSPCPAFASSSPRSACDAIMYSSTDDVEVMNLNALD